jgi:surfeit locus 1 family protein
MIKRLLPPLFVLGAVLTLLCFSYWQVQRLEWKQGLIAAYEAAAKAAPVPIESREPLSREKDNYVHVTLRGKYLPEHELDLGGRRLYTKTGYHVLTPLKTSSGEVFLVNRGWVPVELKDPTKRPKTLTTKEVSVSGMIRYPEASGMFTPANHPEKNFWFTVDIAAMEKETGLKLMPFTVEIVDPQAKRDAFPTPSDGKVVLRNDHLGYAITWFCLAIAAGVIGFLRLRKP